MIPELAESALDWRPLAEADVPALARLMQASDHLDDTADRSTEQRIRQHHADSVVDPVEHAVIGWEGDSAIAYGWNRPRAGSSNPVQVELAGCVHPARRYERLGRAVFAWQLSRAQQWYTEQHFRSGLQVETYTDAHLSSRRRLYERNGLQPARWFSDLHRHLDNLHGLDGATPEGIVLVPYDDELSEPVRVAHCLAFAHEWGSKPVPVPQWQALMRRPAARPGWSWVALSKGNVVGYALNSLGPGAERDGYAEGWTDRIGVDPQWRGKGIAKALLRRSLTSFALAGLDGAGLGVDSNELRLQLFETLGYEATDTVILYGVKLIEPTVERDVAG